MKDITISETEYNKLKKTQEKQEKQYKRQNDFISQNYDRVSVTLPKGYKEKIKELTGESINGFLNRLVSEEFKRIENSMVYDDQELPFK